MTLIQLASGLDLLDEADTLYAAESWTPCLRLIEYAKNDA
jgi:hypothetical protein